MKNKFTCSIKLLCLVCLILLSKLNTINAQCVNADFSDGNFTGWTGTYFNTCTESILGTCVCSNTNPYYTTGFNQGPDNSPVNDTATEYNQVITIAAAGIDSNLALMGDTLPVVWPGGSGYAARMGTMWQAIESDAIGQGQSMSYTFMVTPGNCNFTYHYAVVLEDGGHAAGEQAYFSVKMLDGNNNEITCAGYSVDATNCRSIGGFTHVANPTYGNIYYKPWSSVIVPLANFIGQTVTITFTTRSCLPSGCAGSHYGYAYLACECAPGTSNIALTHGNGCNGPNPTLTAPSGFAAYSWTGPGLNSSPDSQTVSIKLPGLYTVSLTTPGTFPCTITYDTLVPDSSGFFAADFSYSTSCLDSTVAFTDLSAQHDSIISWAWDFNNDGITDSVAENPTYKFAGLGNYPVKLTITSASCTTDTVINIRVVKQPIVTLASSTPVCPNQYAAIQYSVNDTNAVNFSYTWNFDSTNFIYDTGFGGYFVAWATSGTKNITVVVADNNCSTPVVSVQVVVKPLPNLGLVRDTGICVGSIINLTASGATSYAWNADSTLSDTTTATVIATPDTTTTYIITGNLNGCQATDSVTVNLIAIPIITLNTSDTACVNETISISFASTDSTTVYSWNFDGGMGYADTALPLEWIAWPVSGAKTIIASANTRGCITADTTMIQVLPLPVLTLIGDTTGCLGSQLTLSVTGASIYFWQVDTNTYTSDTITLPLDSVTATLAVTGIDNYGCSTTDTVSITANASAVVSFATSGPVCVGDTLTVSFTGSAVAGATFNWNFGYGSANTLTGTGPISVSWDSAGFCPVSVTVSQYGCVSTFADTIPVQICDGIKPVAATVISIYPNPAKNDFTVEVTGAINNGLLEITDVLGQVLYVYEMKNVTTGFSRQIHLDVAAGVYFVSLRNADKQFTKKMVIE